MYVDSIQSHTQVIAAADRGLTATAGELVCGGGKHAQAPRSRAVSEDSALSGLPLCLCSLQMLRPAMAWAGRV